MKLSQREQCDLSYAILDSGFWIVQPRLADFQDVCIRDLQPITYNLQPNTQLIIKVLLMPFPWYLLLIWAYATIILSYWRAWRKVVPFQVPDDHIPVTPISVIVPARNEEANIHACLRSLLAQSYPSDLYEIIVVDDFSTDGTAASVSAVQDTRVRLLRMQDVPGMEAHTSSKKKAIARGVSMARNVLILTTDADCTCPPEWLRTMAACQSATQAVFLAAPVRYGEGKGLLHAFETLDFMTLQGITIAAASNGMHVMSNGANLGYLKGAFDALGGFSGVDHIASGDDMLLQQKFMAAHPSRVTYCTAPSAIVTTKGAGSWRAFIRQRIRWASKARHYKEPGLLFILVVVYLFNLLLLVMPFLYVIDTDYLWIWLVLMFLKCLVELIFLVPVARFFGKTRTL